MSYIKNTSNNKIITRYVSAERAQEAILTIQTALDGTEYLTRFGSPFIAYRLSFYVQKAGRDALMDAIDTLTLLEVKGKEGTIRGRLKELSEFTPVSSEWYEGSALLAATSEVSDR